MWVKFPHSKMTIMTIMTIIIMLSRLENGVWLSKLEDVIGWGQKYVVWGSKVATVSENEML